MPAKTFFRMAPDQYDADLNIEGFLIWEIKIADQSFGMDIPGTEQEILSLFHNVCHVVRLDPPSRSNPVT